MITKHFQEVLAELNDAELQEDEEEDSDAEAS